MIASHKQEVLKQNHHSYGFSFLFWKKKWPMFFMRHNDPYMGFISTLGNWHYLLTSRDVYLKMKLWDGVRDWVAPALLTQQERVYAIWFLGHTKGSKTCDINIISGRNNSLVMLVLLYSNQCDVWMKYLYAHMMPLLKRNQWVTGSKKREWSQQGWGDKKGPSLCLAYIIHMERTMVHAWYCRDEAYQDSRLT